MDDLNQAISILMKVLFRSADREEIDRNVKEAIDLLEKAKKKLR